MGPLEKDQSGSAGREEAREPATEAARAAPDAGRRAPGAALPRLGARLLVAAETSSSQILSGKREREGDPNVCRFFLRSFFAKIQQKRL